jgi:D-inositol-3-phosphate glycosyltransferase
MDAAPTVERAKPWPQSGQKAQKAQDMISFVWPPGASMLAGTGGSETYTAGHIRELRRRGIDAQVVTVGHGTNDGRKDFADIPFLALEDASGISKLAGTVVFVNRAYDVPTLNKAAIILHYITPGSDQRKQRQADIKDKIVIATSIYNGQHWAVFLNIPYSRIHIVLPFADPIFGNVKHAKSSGKTRILYAGRLHPEKGIYTLLEALHERVMRKNGHRVSIVMAGQHVEEGKSIARMLEGYPYARLISPRKQVADMAALLAHSDILLMPSVFAEPFGMLSVEAQHTGCRVVASNIGGLPETNCGLLTVVEPRNPRALIAGIEKAVALGAATKRERDRARNSFMLDESVDALLKALHL